LWNISSPPLIYRPCGNPIVVAVSFLVCSRKPRYYSFNVRRWSFSSPPLVPPPYQCFGRHRVSGTTAKTFCHSRVASLFDLDLLPAKNLGAPLRSPHGVDLEYGVQPIFPLFISFNCPATSTTMPQPFWSAEPSHFVSSLALWFLCAGLVL